MKFLQGAQGSSYKIFKKVKGSKVEYALQTIERILEKQNMLSSNLTNVSGHPPVLSDNKSPLGAQSSQFLDHRNVQQQNIPGDLIKPDEKVQGLSNHFLEKKKRRKKQGQSHHL